MAVRLRLTRMGSKKRPFYRIIAVDSRKRRDGRALEYLGYYNPILDSNAFEIDMEKVQQWLDRGAKPTETVSSLLAKAQAKG